VSSTIAQDSPLRQPPERVSARTFFIDRDEIGRSTARLLYNHRLVSQQNPTEETMPRRRKPAGLECLVELARKAAILEREMSAQRAAIERLTENATGAAEKAERRAATAIQTPSSPNWCPDTAP
jgi:hypothetical protein